MRGKRKDTKNGRREGNEIKKIKVLEYALLVNMAIGVIFLIVSFPSSRVSWMYLSIIILCYSIFGVLNWNTRRRLFWNSFFSKVILMVMGINKRPDRQDGDCGKFANKEPPERAELFLLWVLPRKDWEEVIGDFTEKFYWIQKRSSVKLARRWFWWQTIRSCTSFVYTRLSTAIKALMKFLPFN